MNKLYKAHIDTPLGTMIAIADDDTLHLLEFRDRVNIEKQLKKLSQFQISNQSNSVIDTAQQELNDYFNGTLKSFKTPLKIYGLKFQQSIMQTLIDIPYGQTRSYSDQAQSVGNDNACQAVGSANGRNQIAIIIPCHRVIGKNGNLTGYAGGLKRKKWLLNHERKHA